MAVLPNVVVVVEGCFPRLLCSIMATTWAIFDESRLRSRGKNKGSLAKTMNTSFLKEIYFGAGATTWVLVVCTTVYSDYAGDSGFMVIIRMP